MKLNYHDITHSVDVKLVLDTISWGALLGSMVDVLPHAATGLTVVWMSMRIGETLYNWFKNKEPLNKE